MGITYARDPSTGLLQAIKISGDAPSNTEVQRIHNWQRSRIPAPAPVTAPPAEETGGIMDWFGEVGRGGIEGLASLPRGLTGLIAPESVIDPQEGTWGALTRDIAEGGESVGRRLFGEPEEGDLYEIGRGLGSIAPSYAAAIATIPFTGGMSALGALATTSLAGGAVGAAIGSDEAVRTIEQRTAAGEDITDEQAKQLVRSFGLIGTAEGIPVGLTLGPIGKVLRKVPASKLPLAQSILKSRIARSGGRVMLDATAEGAQELADQLAKDFAEQKIIDPDLKVGEDAWAAWQTGAGVGGIVGVLAEAFGRRGRGARDETEEDRDWEEDVRLEQRDLEGRVAAATRVAEEMAGRPAPAAETLSGLAPETRQPETAIGRTMDTTQQPSGTDVLASRLEAIARRNQESRDAVQEPQAEEVAAVPPPVAPAAQPEPVEDRRAEDRRIVEPTQRAAVEVEQQRRADETRQTRATAATTKAVTPTTAITKSDLKRIPKKMAQSDYGWDKQVWSYTAPDGKEYVAFREEQGGGTIPSGSWAVYERDADISSAAYAGENLGDVADFLSRQQTAPEPEPTETQEFLDQKFRVQEYDEKSQPIGSRVLTRQQMRDEGYPDSLIDQFPREDGTRTSASRAAAPAPQPAAPAWRPLPETEKPDSVTALEAAAKKKLEDVGLPEYAKNFQAVRVLEPQRLMGREPEIIEGLETIEDGVFQMRFATEVYGGDLTPEQNLARGVETVLHEIVHGLRSNKLFTAKEWNVLVNAAKKTKFVRPDATDRSKGTKRSYTYYYKSLKEHTDGSGNLIRSPDYIAEEAVANMFRDWASGRLKIGGQPQSLFRRMMKALKALFGAAQEQVRIQNVESAADLFDMIETGVVGGRERGSGAARPPAADTRKSSVELIDPTPDNIAEIERHSAKVLRTRDFQSWLRQEDGYVPAMNADGTPAILYRGINLLRADPDYDEKLAMILSFKPNPTRRGGVYPVWASSSPDIASTYATPTWDEIAREERGDRAAGTRGFIMPFFVRGTAIRDISDRFVSAEDRADQKRYLEYATPEMLAQERFPPNLKFFKLERYLREIGGVPDGEVWVARDVRDTGTREEVDTVTRAENIGGDIYIFGRNVDARPVYSFRDADVTPSDTGTPAQRFSALRQRASTAERALSKADPQRSNIAVEAVRAAHRLLPMISDPDAPPMPERAVALLRALRGRLSSGDLDNLGDAGEYLQDYADIQAEVPVHNAMQWRARAIPLAIAEGNTTAALKHVDDMLRGNIGEARHYQEGFDQTQRFSSIKRAMPPPVHVHFVGFRGEEYNSAKKVWGEPDFIHMVHDHRMYGDVGPNDIIVFGPKGREEISEYSDQDHERHSSVRRLPLTSAAKLQVNPLVIEGTGPGGRILKQDYARALTQRHMDMHGRRFDPATSEQDFANVAESMREEYREQLDQQSNGLGWYTADVARAVGITEEIIPTLNPGRSNRAPLVRDILMVNAAITSPQERPVPNWEKAVELTERYEKDGKLPFVKENGKGWGFGESNVRLFQFLIDRFGERGAVQFLQQMHSGRDLAMIRKESGLFIPKDTDSLAGYKASEVGLTGEALGVYMFGPKVGDFFLNVSGIDPSAVTVDIWAGQNFNRHIGRLMDVGPKALEQGKIATNPRGVGERNTIKRLYYDLAERTGVEPSAVQAALWYFEQRLERSHGINAPSQNFSEAAEAAARKRGIVPAADTVESIDGVRTEADGQRITARTGPEQRRSRVVLRPDGKVESEKVVASPRYTRRRSEEAGNPVTETDLYSLNEDFFRRPGWGVIATGRPDNTDALSVREAQSRNDNFRRTLDYMGLPYREARGFYKGNDEGTSFLVLADEATMIRLGKQNQQESVITSSGLIYTNINAADTPATGGVFTGDEARRQEGFTEVGEDAFSLDLDWDIGPGIAQVPENFYFHVDRPQLPISRETGMAELHHFSPRRLETIDPAYADTGTLVGPERKYGWKVSFYGINPRNNYREPGTGYVREDERWRYDHVVEVDPKDLYPWYENPDGIETNDSRTEYHANIRKAGYKGYYVTDDGSGRAPLGNVAVLYEAIPVTRVNEDVRASSARLSRRQTGPGTASGAGATLQSVNASRRSRKFDRHLVEAENRMIYGRVSKGLEKVLGIFTRDPAKREELADDLVMKWQDRFLPVGKMVDELRAQGYEVWEDIDAYMREINMHGHVGEMIRDRTENLYTPIGEAIGRITLAPQDVTALRNISDAASPSGVGFVSTAIDSFRKNELSLKTRVLTWAGLTNPDRLAVADAYLYAKHAPWRNQWIVENGGEPNGSGMTDAEAEAITGFIENLPEEKRAGFEEVFDLGQRIVADMNAVSKEAGTIPEDIVGMRFWVPLTGKVGEDGFIDEGKGVPIATPYAGVRGSESRRVAGREGYAANSMVAELIAQSQRRVLRGEKNKVGQSFLKLLREYPEQLRNWAEITGPPLQRTLTGTKVRWTPIAGAMAPGDILTVKENGEWKYIKLNDHRLMRAFQTNVAPSVPGAAVRTMRKLTRFLANVNTSWNPEFLMSNFPRDVQTALVNASQYDIDGIWKTMMSPGRMKDTARALWAVERYRDNALDHVRNDRQRELVQRYIEFRKAGGMNITNQMGNIEEIENGLDMALGMISSEGSKDFSKRNAVRLAKGWQSLFQILEDYNTIAENITRVNFYDALISHGASPERAAMAARDLTTNFAKGGEYKTAANGAYLFYNASLQGTMALLRAFMRSPKVRKMWGSLILLGFMQDQIGAMFGGEDDDGNLLYDDIGEYDLEHNIILPDIFNFTGRGHFKVPLAYGLNMPWNAGRAMSRYLRGGYDTADLYSTMSGPIWETVWPLGGDESWWNMIAPTFLDPAVDLLENENFMEVPIYKDERSFGVDTPRAYRHFSSTGSTWKWITENLNDVTLGNEVREGWISINPDVLEYLFEYFTGATGATVSRIVTTGTDVVPDIIRGEAEAEFVRQVPFMRKLYGHTTEQIETGKFFSKSEDVERARKEFIKARKVGDKEWENSVRKNYAEELKVYGRVRALVNQRNKIKKAIREITENPRIPDARKKVLIDRLNERIRDIIRKGNAIMKDV